MIIDLKLHCAGCRPLEELNHIIADDHRNVFILGEGSHQIRVSLAVSQENVEVLIHPVDDESQSIRWFGPVKPNLSHWTPLPPPTKKPKKDWTCFIRRIEPATHPAPSP